MWFLCFLCFEFFLFRFLRPVNFLWWQDESTTATIPAESADSAISAYSKGDSNWATCHPTSYRTRSRLGPLFFTLLWACWFFIKRFGFQFIVHRQHFRHFKKKNNYNIVFIQLITTQIITLLLIVIHQYAYIKNTSIFNSQKVYLFILGKLFLLINICLSHINSFNKSLTKTDMR